MDKVTIDNKTFELFINAQTLDALVTDLAKKINAHYKDLDEVLLISILDGSFIFMSDLVRKLNFLPEIQFVKLKSYRDTQSSGQVDFILDIDTEIASKHVLIIEDIIDTGLTIEKFYERLDGLKPKSLKCCALFSKPDVHNDIIKIDFIGKEIAPEFILGYGLDLNGLGRNLPGIYKLKI